MYSIFFWFSLLYYKLKKKIGEGSFGKIYIASDTNTKEEYAVKLVRNKNL